jgi:hypothetical protein
MAQAERPTCPHCGAYLILALPPGGKGQRSFQCLDCERPDPLKTDRVNGWLKGELQPPKVGKRADNETRFAMLLLWESCRIKSVVNAPICSSGSKGAVGSHIR